MKRRSLKQWIRENRRQIDAAIAQALGMARNPIPNDAERRLWVLNDEGLYNWARSEGIDV